MPRGGAHFSSEELVRVLSHYDIGVIHQIRPLSGGSRRTPKMVIIAEKGKFLLKRRPKGKDDLYRVAFAHAVQARLAEKGFPVTALIPTRHEDNTILQLNNHIYELFSFVTGSRYNGSAEATFETGRQLANFHRHLAGFAPRWRPPRAGFHDSPTVRRHLRTLGSEKFPRLDRRLQAVAEALMPLYNDAGARVNQCGFDSWNQQVVHGDWHPGNMLFADDRIVAVLDFDAIRVAPPVTDLANAMLQFSIVAGSSNPVDWPDHFDEEKLTPLLAGYRRANPLEPAKLDALPGLMIETMIAEAVLPIVATGFFGNLSGPDFLQMILRKAKWLDKNRTRLRELIRATGQSR